MDYPITLSGVPSGTGMYQQLLAINPSTYGISSSGGNVLFYDSSNDTPLYAWLQSISTTSASYWIKNFNGSNGITMRVVSNANYFSSTGYLGEAPQLSSVYNSSNNMLRVFPIAFAFTDHISNFWNYNSTSQAVNGVDSHDGLNFFINSTTTEDVFITRHANDLPNYYFGFTVSSYSNGSVLASWWNGTDTYQTGAVTVNHAGNYVITNTINEATPIFDNDGVNPTYMTISDIFFYSALTMPTFTIGSGSSVTTPNQPTYQQLLTISNPSAYGINSQGSNVQFTAQNGTLLYAWIQSINSSSMQLWVKNYYGNNIIEMQVLPSFENLFSATGHLGAWANITGTFNNAIDNGALVFNNYWNFAGTTLPSYASIEASPTADNGLIFTSQQGIAFDISMPSSGAIVESGYYFPNSSYFGSDSDYEIGFGYGGFPSPSGGFYTNGYSSSNFGGNNIGLYIVQYSSQSGSVIAGPTVIGSPSSNVFYKNYFAFGPNGALTSGWDSTYLSATNTTHSLNQVTQVFIWQGGVGDPHITTNWLRTRTYVSSMPTYSIGSGIGIAVAIPSTANNINSHYWNGSYWNASASGFIGFWQITEASPASLPVMVTNPIQISQGYTESVSSTSSAEVTLFTVPNGKKYKLLNVYFAGIGTGAAVNVYAFILRNGEPINVPSCLNFGGQEVLYFENVNLATSSCFGGASFVGSSATAAAMVNQIWPTYPEMYPGDQLLISNPLTSPLTAAAYIVMPL
jgi:hypothetical protein